MSSLVKSSLISALLLLVLVGGAFSLGRESLLGGRITDVTPCVSPPTGFVFSTSGPIEGTYFIDHVPKYLKHKVPAPGIWYLGLVDPSPAKCVEYYRKGKPVYIHAPGGTVRFTGTS